MTGRKIKTLEEAIAILDSSSHQIVKDAMVTVKEEIASMEGQINNMHYRLYGAGCKPGGTPPWMRAGRQRESK